MATKAIFYIDDGGVEYTDYVNLKVKSVTYLCNRQLELIPGNQGSNTYADDRRYSEKWTLNLLVDRATDEALRTFVKAAFVATTKLRVYVKAGGVDYTDYSPVKILSYGFTSTDLQKFNTTLVIGK